MTVHSTTDKTPPRNPYHKDGQPPGFLQSVVVYLDVLGYREMWVRAEREGEQDSFLQRLYQALDEGQQWLRDDGSDLWPVDRDCYAIKAFTDNIVIGWPVLSNAESELISMFSRVAYFQLGMANHGFFLRGATFFRSHQS